MSQEMNEIVSNGILDKFLQDVMVIQYVMNSMLAIQFLLKEMPNDDMLNHTKEQGQLVLFSTVENTESLGKFIRDKFFNGFNSEDKELFLQSEEILASITAINAAKQTAIQPTSNKVH